MRVHPALRYSALRQLPKDLRECARLAYGPSPRLEDVQSLIQCSLLERDWTFVRPIVYQVLDPIYIPAPSQINRLPARGKFADRLRCVWFLFDFMSNYDIFQPVPDVTGFFWERSWRWIQILDDYHMFLPHVSSQSRSVVLFTCAALMGRLSKHEPTHQVMIRTAGTLSLLTRAWNVHTDIGDPALKRLGILASDHFWMTISLILPDQLDAAIQACGGSVVDVARFIVQGLDAKLRMLTLFHDKQPAFTLAPFLLLMDSMLRAPGSDFLNSLVNHGILGVLTDVLSVLKGDFVAQFHPIVVIALEVIVRSINCPRQISIARTNGLMRVILTLGQRDRDPLVQDKISLIISMIAPQCLVHQRALNTLHDIREGLSNLFPVDRSL